jgi:hypothetical protein
VAKENNEENFALWEKYRLNCAAVYPSSSFAIEQKVLDSWCLLNGKSENDLIFGDTQINIGGLRVSLRSKFIKPQEKQAFSRDGCSDAAYEMYSALENSCNPAVKPTVPSGFIQDFLCKLSTEKDCNELLPVVVLLWRQLCSSSRHSGYETPNETVSDLILKKTSPDTAIKMLRHKMVYKLSPSVEGIEFIMLSLKEQAVKEASESIKTCMVDPLVEEQAEESWEAGKRKRIPRKEYPFRQAPRFYYYKPIPFVLNPEPSPFFESTLPELPNTNHTKRLLPDDKQLKLKLMIDEEEAKEKTNNEKYAGMNALDKLFQVYYYATSDSLRYYKLTPSQKMKDVLSDAVTACGNDKYREILQSNEDSTEE